MRKWTTGASALLAVAIVAAGTTGLAAAVILKLGTLAPVGTQYDLLLKQMSEVWRTSSRGEVTLRVFAGGNQGSEADIVKRMNIGELHAAMLSGVGLSEIDPGVTALQEIPMLFRTLDEQEYVRDKLRPDLERRLAAKGYVALFWGDSGWVRFFSRKPAVHPADFKGMKIFVTAAGAEHSMKIMEALGYTAVPLDYADALIQLQTGRLDAVPAPPVLANAGQFYSATKHMTELNWVPLVGAVVVTTRAWEGIPAPVRAELLKAAADTGRQIQVASRKESNDAVDAMKSHWKLEVHAVPPAIEAEWRAFAESIYPRLRDKIVPGDMFDQARKFVNEYRETHKSLP